MLSKVAHAAEAQIVQPCVGRGVAARGDAIVGAEIFGAHPGAAPDDALRPGGWPNRVIAPCPLIVVISIPVCAPLPDVASHVVNPVAVRLKTLDRRATDETILARVVFGELSLPPVGDRSAQGAQVVAPCISLAHQSSARRVLPLGLRRQTLARPKSVSRSIAP